MTNLTEQLPSIAALMQGNDFLREHVYLPLAANFYDPVGAAIALALMPLGVILMIYVGVRYQR